MVTALKDRTQLEAIASIPRERHCPQCGGRLFIEYGHYCIEDKCINCGRVGQRWPGIVNLGFNYHRKI